MTTNCTFNETEDYDEEYVEEIHEPTIEVQKKITYEPAFVDLYNIEFCEKPNEFHEYKENDSEEGKIFSICIHFYYLDRVFTSILYHEILKC